MSRLLYNFGYVSGMIKNSVFRRRTDCIVFVLDISKIILSQFKRMGEHDQATDVISVLDDPVSRVVLSVSGSHHSLVYPFSVFIDNGCIGVKTKGSGLILDLPMISQLTEYFLSDEYERDEVELGADVIEILNDLMEYEDGYIRFDDDVVRENGRVHPRFHYDIFYTNAAGIKIGIPRRVDASEFIDFLNKETDCHFLA